MTSELGGSEHVTWSALAPFIERTTKMKVRVIPFNIELEKYDQTFSMRGGDLCMGAVHWMLQYYMSPDKTFSVFEKFPSRVWWASYSLPSAFYVAADSPIKTWDDLKTMKGIKVGTSQASPTTTKMMEVTFPALLGMTPEQAKAHFTFVPFASTADFFKGPVEGKCDVAYAMTASATGYEVGSHPKGVRVLEPPMDQATLDALQRVEPGRILERVAYGFPQSVGKVGVSVRKIELCSADLDQEFVYQMTKWMAENYDLYKDVYETLKMSRMDVVRAYLDVNPFPVADGAIKYFKEIGQWTPADDERNKRAIEIQNQYIDAWQAAAAKAKQMGIKIDAANAEWVKLWSDQIANLDKFEIKF
jgi:TRAP-type uncharacterized transport system substrate-binding protein